MLGNGWEWVQNADRKTGEHILVRSITAGDMYESMVGSARHPIFATVIPAFVARHPLGRMRDLEVAVQRTHEELFLATLNHQSLSRSGSEGTEKSEKECCFGP